MGVYLIFMAELTSTKDEQIILLPNNLQGCRRS